jgi:hypothetical protein
VPLQLQCPMEHIKLAHQPVGTYQRGHGPS